MRDPIDPAGFDGFPLHLLNDCREGARMAELLLRQMGTEDTNPRHAPHLSERLSWAIRAIEDDETDGSANGPA